MLQGAGVLNMRDGSRYVGEFRADKFCGLGRIETCNGTANDDGAFSEPLSISHCCKCSCDNTCILRDAMAGHVQEGTWSDDVCTLQHTIDVAVTQRAHAVAEQALALSETGHTARNSAHACLYASLFAPSPPSPPLAVIQMDRRKSMDPRSRSTASPASLSVDPLTPSSAMHSPSKSARRPALPPSPPLLTCPSKAELSAMSVTVYCFALCP